jgi:hypothetical protein
MATIYADNYKKIAAKTAAYTLTPDDNGKVFTNRGAAGSVTFTLPPTADIPIGFNARFFNVVIDQNLVVASHGSADNIVAFNDPTADSIAFSTASERAGSGVEMVWDGTGWLAFVSLGAETATPTVA